MPPFKELLVVVSIIATGWASMTAGQQLYRMYLLTVPGAMTSYHIDEQGFIQLGVPALNMHAIAPQYRPAVNEDKDPTP